MTQIRLDKLNKAYGDQIIFKDAYFAFEKNKINVLIGRSGIGKTTLLNILSKLDKNYTCEKNDFLGLEMTYLFQENRLIPWKTADGNLKYVLKGKMSKEEMDLRIEQILKRVDLYNYRNKYIETLSGGMKRRLAIARAFLLEAPIMLLDEPFKELDQNIKKTLVEAFLHLWHDEKRTCIFVTHDLDEAMELSDVIMVIGEYGKTIKRFDFDDIKKGLGIKNSIIETLKKNID